MVMSSQTAVEELLEMVFSLQSVLRYYKEDNWSKSLEL
jgi:hypothetical protein